MTPILRPLADQLTARVAERDLLTLEELRQLAATIRFAAQRYEEATVLAFRRPEGGNDAA